MNAVEPYTHMPDLTDEQRAVIESYKIPVDSFNPGTYWIASLCYESSMPTEAELRMIQSYIEYAIKHTYNEHYQELIQAKPFPACGGHVTKIFRKGAMWSNQANPTEGWVFRKNTWEGGFWPEWPKPRLSLIEILDHLHCYDWEPEKPLNPSWIKWKLEHPEAFPC